MSPDTGTIAGTIYALSSAGGRAGVAVVRISGPRALEAAGLLAPSVTLRPRFAHHARLVDPADGSALDDGLVLTFPGPRSYTGEDVAELHVHGSPAVLTRLFGVLASLGLAAAERGEFTRRAFANGKMDLTEAEGVADLIASDSEAQRVQALRQMGGAWSERVGDWHGRLLDALAWLEASIDFADEDDVPEDVATGSAAILRAVTAEMTDVLSAPSGEIIRDGLRVAIVGAPNVGKSTLINRLAGRDVAIVSDVPGTTRDVLEVRLDIGGYVAIVADTAGLRATEDVIEVEGVRRARARAGEADLRILVADGAQGDRVGLETDLLRDGDIVLLNKADLGPVALFGEVRPTIQVVEGSALSGMGLEALIEALKDAVMARVGQRGSHLIVRQRQRDALEAALAALRRAMSSTPDLAAEDVRTSLRALGRIVGRFDVEDVLDRVFSSFCIGK